MSRKSEGPVAPFTCTHFRRRGHTLIEMLVASVSATCLIAGMGGSVYIASRSFEDQDSQSSQGLAASEASNQILAEMQYATRFYERSPHVVSFAVPDRDGDGKDERLRYFWSGNAGDPLTKELNESVPKVVVEQVQDLNFSFLTKTLTAPPPPVVPQVVFHEYVEAISETGRLQIATPANAVGGDLLVAAIAIDGHPPEIGTATGWNHVVTSDNSSAVTIGVWWRLCDSNEPITHSFKWGERSHGYGWIMRFSGHDASSPLNAWAASAATTTKNVGTTNWFSPTRDTTYTIGNPTITTTIDNTLVVQVGAFDGNSINEGNPGVSGYTGITMAGTTKVSGGAAYMEPAPKGTLVPSTFALTSSEEAVVVALAISPAQ